MKKKTPSLKELIKERRAKTDESYAEARRQILVQQKRCTRCMTPLETRVAGHRPFDMGEGDLDDLTDGQAADYWDEMENPGIGNNWSDPVLVELCPTCEELTFGGPPHLARHLEPEETPPRPRRKT